MSGSDGQHCSFVLLAEFNIDRGAQLTYQFPQPLGTDEGLLANLMLPDGAEKQLEDWTIFFLNQTPFNTIAPVLALEKPSANEDVDKPELLYVLNLVRTKHDKTVRRGAVVKAMAVCTRYPFIQIFKPVLLLALDDYFSDPSQDCLARLFDSINSMDISAAPTFHRFEKLVMRNSERKDVFAEKFVPPKPSPNPSHNSQAKGLHAPKASVDSRSSFEEGIIMRTGGNSKEQQQPSQAQGRERSGTQASTKSSHYSVVPSEDSFSLGGKAVWVGEESGLMEQESVSNGSVGTAVGLGRGRRSTDASSSSSHHTRKEDYVNYHGSIGSMATPMANGTSSDTHLRPAYAKDTHFFHTVIDYEGHQLPIKMPLSTFPEEVGDYSLIQLIQTFSSPASTLSGPLHPHLHTNGPATHPIMILFNALVTGKRIIFLGYQRPAGQVSSYVLSACALGSGCGTIFRGFIERAFPYANLTNREEWESIPAYIAGVTNPIFETSGSWDLLCDVGTGRVVVSKDILAAHPPSGPPSGAPPLISRVGTLKTETSIGSEEDAGRREPMPGQAQSNFAGKSDGGDNAFIEDIIAAINYHFGESLVRARFTEYLMRFIRLASRYEEDVLGMTTIGYPSTVFSEGPGDSSQLGSGMVFLDEAAGAREVTANASRIEGWRRTQTYHYFQEDFRKGLETNAIQGFDLLHQLHRLRHVKQMQDGEAEAIIRTMAENIQTYDQVVELLAMLPPHVGGLLPLSFGLLHQQEVIRELTVDLFTHIRMFPIGVQFLQSLNHFQRYAYVRQAHAREHRANGMKDSSLPLPPVSFARTPSNLSEASLGGG